MPQLNPEFFLSQVFWLVLTFSFLLFFLWRITLPRISSILENRKDRINSDIEEAKKLQNEAEKKQDEIELQILKSKNEAENKLKESIDFFKQDIDKKLLSLDQDLEKKIEAAKSEIEKNKENSIKDLSDHIINLTSIAYEKIIGSKVDENSLKEIVKKNFNGDRKIN